MRANTGWEGELCLNINEVELEVLDAGQIRQFNDLV